MRRLAAPALGLGLGIATACGPPPADVLAVYSDGEVTRAELDARVLDLPAGQRRPPTDEPGAWFEALIRQCAVDELLLAEMERNGFDGSPEFERRWYGTRRQILASWVVQDAQAEEGAPAPSEAELRAYFESHREELVQEARRDVAHVYVRRRSGESDAELHERAGALRRTVVAGESFENVARRFSDSESRFSGGLLGWIRRGQLDPEAEEVIFRLQEGEISEVVLTRDGAHFFQVRQVVAPRELDFEEMRRPLTQRLAVERQSAFVEDLVAGVELPADTFIPDAEQLQVLLASGDDEALVLRIGDLTLTAGELRRRVRPSPGAAGSEPGPHAVVRALVQSERLARLAGELRLAEEPRRAEQLRDLRQRAALEAYREHRLREWVAADEALLRAHYSANRRRFSTPLRIELEILSVPRGADPVGRMAALEAELPRLDDGAVTLGDLRERWAGTLRSPSWFEITDLRSSHPRLAAAVGALEVGRYAAPVAAAAESFFLARVTDRVEPEAEPFDTARARVVEHLLQTEGAALYERMRRELLDGARYRLLEDRVEALLTVD